MEPGAVASVVAGEAGIHQARSAQWPFVRVPRFAQMALRMLGSAIARVEEHRGRRRLRRIAERAISPEQLLLAPLPDLSDIFDGPKERWRP
jgi:hypothetical protein